MADELTELRGTGNALRELESHFLNEAGYSVGFEQDGHSALAQARTLVPDIIRGRPRPAIVADLAMILDGQKVSDDRVMAPIPW